MTEDNEGPNISSESASREFPQRRHLRRLDRIFDCHQTPLFFITVCTRHRQRYLSDPNAAAIIVATLAEAESTYGWIVGRYIVMPDHVHMFCAPGSDEARDLSSFIGYWKRSTAMRIRRSCITNFAWQPEFFDHLMRSHESYAEKWEYVRQNPVRAGLVEQPEEYPYQGEIHELQW